jgi:hypothetical protein
MLPGGGVSVGMSELLRPPLVATIGLHGSAPTWGFNVGRELMLAASLDRPVLAVLAEKCEELPAESARGNQWLVVKSHRSSEGLDAWHSITTPASS